MEEPGKGKQKIPGGDNKQPQQTILNKNQKRGKHTTQGRKECSNKRTKEPAAKVGSLEDPKRRRRTTQDEVQFRRDFGAWETRFWILPTKIAVEGGAGMGLFAARNYAKGESLVVCMGEDIGPADELPTVDTLKGQSQHTLQIKKRLIRNRLIDGLHGASCAQFINSAYHLNRGNNVNFTDTGNIVAGKKGLCAGEELLMGYKIGFWNGIQRAKKWRDENPEASARLDVEAVERDKQRRIPRVEVPPEKKEKNKKRTDEEHTHMEGEATSELDGPTDTTATEAVNESGAAKAKAKVVGRADDNRGDRRGTETENGRDSDVADNESRHTTEAMHRKEGPNIKLNNNKRPRCTDKKENNQRSQPTEGAQNKNNNIDTDTERSIKKTRKRLRTDSVSNHYGDKGQVGDMYGTR